MYRSIVRFTVFFAFFSIVTVFAVMPPQVYIKRIKESQVKALAVVKNVEVTAEKEHYIAKKVEFELIDSYGKVKPSKVFYGSCKSSTGTPWVGGDIYYYPVAGEKVFVTISLYGQIKENQCVYGEITSYTPVTVELENCLKKDGLDCIEYGMSRVRVKE